VQSPVPTLQVGKINFTHEQLMNDNIHVVLIRAIDLFTFPMAGVSLWCS